MAKSKIKKHAKFSASSSDRWLNCPASVSMSAKVPPLPSTEFADEGSAAHEMGEIALTKKINANKVTANMLSASYKKYHNASMQKFVQHYLNIVRALHLPQNKILIEAKISLAFIHPEMFGTTDHGVIEPWGDIYVDDLKFGKGKIVKAENNSQAAFYGVGMAHAADWEFDKAHLRIIQPRVSLTPSVWTVTNAELKKWVEIFREGVKAAEAKNPTFNEGAWCQYCPAQKICPKLGSAAREIATTAFDDGAGETTPALSSAKEISKMTADDIGKALALIDKIDKWKKAIYAEAFSRLQMNKKITGYKLASKRPTRVWNNERRAEAFLRVEIGQDAFKKSLISPAQAEELGNKKVNQYVKKNTALVSSGDKIVPITSKETEAKSALTEAFDDGTF